MSISSLHTIDLPHLLARLRGGDRDAADELIRRAGRRLEEMARGMLRRYPVVAQREQAEDVLQEASTSLLSALRTLDVADTRAFYGLAAEHLRRRLLDLARRHRRGGGGPVSLERLPGRGAEIPAPADADLGRWEALHEAVERLPAAPREAFSLRFYHGWTWQETADLLGVSVPTARQRWYEAMAHLADWLRELPSPEGG